MKAENTSKYTRSTSDTERITKGRAILNGVLRQIGGMSVIAAVAQTVGDFGAKDFAYYDGMAALELGTILNIAKTASDVVKAK